MKSLRKRVKVEMNGIIKIKMMKMVQWVTKKVEIYLRRKKKKMNKITDSSMKVVIKMISMMMMILNLNKMTTNLMRQILLNPLLQLLQEVIQVLLLH